MYPTAPTFSIGDDTTPRRWDTGELCPDYEGLTVVYFASHADLEPWLFRTWLEGGSRHWHALYQDDWPTENIRHHHDRED